MTTPWPVFAVPYQTCQLPPACPCGLTRMGDGFLCAYCQTRIGKPLATKKSQRDEDSARLDAAKLRAVEITRALVEESRARSRRATTPKKPKQKRGPNRTTLAKRAAQDAVIDARPDTELSPALSGDTFPDAPWMRDEVEKP